jgi:hypothetical protein
MGKSKSTKVAAATPLKNVKDGRVAKPSSNTKAKAKEIAKAFVSKGKAAASKKKVESESEDDSEDDSESQSDSDAEESDVEDAKPNGKANGKANGLKATVDDESDESSDSDEDEAPVKKANGTTTAGAEDEDEDDSSDDDEVDAGKAAGKFEPDSDASDDDDESSDDDEEEAKSETPKAAPVKVNGHSKADVSALASFEDLDLIQKRPRTMTPKLRMTPTLMKIPRTSPRTLLPPKQSCRRSARPPTNMRAPPRSRRWKMRARMSRPTRPRTSSSVA